MIWIELWDILDEDGNKTGELVARGRPMKQDEYHLVVHVWIRNSKGQFLISKRTPNKTFPNMWETTGGSAIKGEDSLSAALREVREEIGINLSLIADVSLDKKDNTLIFLILLMYGYSMKMSILLK